MIRQIGKIKLVIFDVDGTLYNQKKLRFLMVLELFFYYLLRPHKYYELKVLWIFRREREKHAMEQSINIRENQYKWCQEKVEQPIEDIKRIIQKWIFEKPLKYLPYCSYKNAQELITELKRIGILTSVYSDYRAEKKLVSMGIQVDYTFSAEQEQIDVLKPNPKGLNYISTYLQIKKQDILFIGDRLELDGECAKQAGIDYIIVNRKNVNLVYNELIDELRKSRKK